MKIAIINGPNINMLGIRETSTYGNKNLQDITDMLTQEAKKHHAELVFKQSNHEGKIVDFIQSLHKKCDFIIMNPAAYTHKCSYKGCYISRKYSINRGTYQQRT